MIRRVGKERFEFFGVVWRTVVRGPCPPPRELMEAQHVHHADSRKRRAEKVWPLVQARTNEKPAVAASGDRELILGSILVGDKPFGCGNEIVEHVLLLQ